MSQPLPHKKLKKRSFKNLFNFPTDQNKKNIFFLENLSFSFINLYKPFPPFILLKRKTQEKYANRCWKPRVD